MIQLSNKEYAGLIAARDAMQSALHHLAEVVEAQEHAGEDCVPWHLQDVTAADVRERPKLWAPPMWANGNLEAAAKVCQAGTNA